MDKEKFGALLPLIITSLLQKIIEREAISQNEAILKLYNSVIYSLLEDEQTKLWHYSAEKLFWLFYDEMHNGRIELSEIT